MWLEIIQFILILSIPIFTFIGRNWLKSYFEASTKHKFAEKLESIREEIREKEAEISALRSVVLDGRANRRTILNQRQIQAAELILEAMNDLSPYKGACGMMATIKIDYVSKQISREPKLQKFFEIIVNNAPEPDQASDVSYKARLFLPPLVWAYFQAYKITVLHSYMLAKLFSLGAENTLEYLNAEQVKSLLRTALPQHIEFIDAHDVNMMHPLLEIIENQLIDELKKFINGDTEGINDAHLASRILEEVKNINLKKTDASLN